MPERFSTTELFTCSEVVEKVTLPLKFPLAGGAKVTVAEVESPDCKVSGKARLLNVKAAPLSVAWLTVTALAPMFERVTELA